MFLFMLRLIGPVVDKISQDLYVAFLLKILKRVGIVLEGKPLWVSPDVYLDSKGGSISLGDRVVISKNVSILTHDFSFDRFYETVNGVSDFEIVRKADVCIGDNVFIGLGAVILPGISIGPGSIIGAGAVVTKDVGALQIVGGNPARLIGSVPESFTKNERNFGLQLRRR